MGKSLKVCMVNTAARRGGAARAAATLLKALNAASVPVEAELLHFEDSQKDADNIGLRRSWSREANALLFRLGGESGVVDMAAAGELVRRSADYDLIHLHNLHGYYLDWARLLEGIKDKPIVWTWHDMWPVTGRCAFSFDCALWKTGCDRCPHKDYYPAAWVDWAARDYQTKRDSLLALQKCLVVCPSEWLARIGREAGFPPDRVTAVPNAVDLTSYKVIEKKEARTRLGLPLEEQLLLFVAADCADPRKGFPEFCQVVESLGVRGVAVGGKPENAPSCIELAGPTSDKTMLNYYYCAADAFVITSHIDNYPNTVIEALACGTPVFGFGIGGIPEQPPAWWDGIVDGADVTKLTARLAEWFDLADAERPPSRAFVDHANAMWHPEVIAAAYHESYKTAMQLSSKG